MKLKVQGTEVSVYNFLTSTQVLMRYMSRVNGNVIRMIGKGIDQTRNDIAQGVSA